MASARVTELEALLVRIQRANACLGSFDGWDRWGRSTADAAAAKQMEDEASAAMADLTAATRDLEALVGELRVDAPHEVAAWADAHDTLLAAYLASEDAHGPYAESAAKAAADARGAWAEVKAGTRAYVDGGSYAETRDKARYRELLGVDA